MCVCVSECECVCVCVSFGVKAVVLVQADLSDCRELPNRLFHYLSDARGMPGGGVVPELAYQGGCPNLR